MTVDEVRTRLLDYLPDPYDKEPGSVNYGLMTAYATELNELYAVIGLLHTQLYVNTATGAYLDELARIFRLSRKTGETDAQFRGRIKAYWEVFSGGATIQAIKDAIQALTTLEVPAVVIDEFEPLKFRVVFPLPELSLLQIESVQEATENAKAAGTYAFYTVSYTADQDEVLVGETINLQANGGIIVSYYDVSSEAVL